MGWIGMESDELMLLAAVCSVFVVPGARTGGCRLRANVNGVSFVDYFAWTWYVIFNGVT